jgi:hypothetical protein
MSYRRFSAIMLRCPVAAALLCAGLALQGPRIASAAPPGASDLLEPAGADPAGAGFGLADLLARNLVRLELGGTVLRESDGGDTYNIVTAVLSAQLTPIAGLTFFGSLPFARAGGEYDPEIDLGNVSVGARHAGRPGRLGYGVGGSVAFATSPWFRFLGPGEDGLATTVAAFTHPERFADFAPDTQTYRLAADLRWDGPRTFIQAQLAGQRAMMPEGDLDLLSATVAAGRRLAAGFWVAAQVDTVSLLLEAEAEDGNRWLHTASLGARHGSGSLGIGGRLYLPLDTFLEDDALGLGLMVDLVSRF